MCCKGCCNRGPINNKKDKKGKRRGSKSKERGRRHGHKKHNSQKM